MTSTERNRKRRASLKKQGLSEVRNIMAPAELHFVIKAMAAQWMRENMK